MVRFFLFFSLMISTVVHAEYRVFELEITTYAEVPADAPAEAQKAPPEELEKKYVISNLDPQQYRGYNTVLPNQRVRYVSTWRCTGRTSDKDYCPNPKVKTDDISAAAPLETK